MAVKLKIDLLPEPLLALFRERADGYDRDNAFFAEDFDALRERGYLAASAPKHFGGYGLSLTDLVAKQRTLAAHAPATALGVNMHLVWVQVARYLHARDDHRLDWVFTEACAGEVFAFGISEAGNDAVLLDAKSKAVAQPNGAYRVNGTKIFTTLSPVWSRLGVHAKVDGTDQLVFGFVRRDPLPSGTVIREPGQGHLGLRHGSLTHPGSWNPLGMRATQSYTTQLNDVVIESSDVAARMPTYDASDALVLAIFSSFSLLTASVYAGIADRALELATVAAQQTTSTMRGELIQKLDDPDIATRLTAALLQQRQAMNTLQMLCRDIDDQTTRDDWFIALAAARNQVTDAAQHCVSMAMRVVGASAYQADSELARLSRDVLAGFYHPSSAATLARNVRASIAARETTN